MQFSLFAGLASLRRMVIEETDRKVIGKDPLDDSFDYARDVKRPTPVRSKRKVTDVRNGCSTKSADSEYARWDERTMIVLLAINAAMQ